MHLCKDKIKASIVMVVAVMMSLTAFAGAAQATPGVPPGAFVDADRDLVLDVGEAQFATIQAAIDAAPAGGQVVVTPGIYDEQITISKSLSLLSDPSSAKPVLLCPATLIGDDAIAVLDGPGNRILVQGLVFQGPGPLLGSFNGAILVKNDAIADIVGNVFRSIISPSSPSNNQSYAINVGHSRAGGMGIATAQARVYNNTFSACYPGAVSVAGFGSVLNLDSNDIYGRGGGLAYDNLPQWGVLVVDEAQAVITYNNITGIGSTAGGAAILSFNGTDVDINNNIITGIADSFDVSIGVQLQGTGLVAGFGPGSMNLTNAIVDNNIISGHWAGIYLLQSRQDYWSMTSPPEITNNLISANTVIGLQLEAVDNVTVSYNTITGNGLYGVYVAALFNDVLIQDNNIYGNHPGVLGTISGLHNFSPTNVVDAAYNYWGSPTGPGGEWLGTGDGINEGVLFDPWYTAPVVGGSAISAAGSRGAISGSATFVSPQAALNITLVASGAHTVTAMLFTGAPYPGMANPLPRYYHFRLDTVTGITQVIVDAKYDSVHGINEDSLRLYYYDGGFWEQFTTSSVDMINKTVSGTISLGGASPAISMLSGDFLIALGQPSITVAPMTGPVGTNITITGTGFRPNSAVSVAFDRVPVAFTFSDSAGNIIPVQLRAPALAASMYEVRATDSEGSFGVGIFNLVDRTPLDLGLTAYPTYYLHELVQWDLSISLGGAPTDVDVLTVDLLTPTGTISLSSATHRLGIGQYRTYYTVNGPIGNYTLLIEARKGVTHQGDAARLFSVGGALPVGTSISSLGSNEAVLQSAAELRTFQRTPMAFALRQVSGTTATVGSVLGDVTASFDVIGAMLSSISASTVTITSQVGAVSQAASLVHAAALSYQEGNILVRTDIGSISTSNASIDATVVDVLGTTTSIATSVGEFQTSAANVHATLMDVVGIVAHISTDLNIVAENPTRINGTLQDVRLLDAMILSDIGSITQEAALINAQVTQVFGTTAIVESTIGSLQVPSSQLVAYLFGVNGSNAIIATSLNQLTEAAVLINAQVVQVLDLNANINSSIGTVIVLAQNVGAELISINGDNVTIFTLLNNVVQEAVLINAHAVEVTDLQTIISSSVGPLWITNSEAGVALISISGYNGTIFTDYGTVVENVFPLGAYISTLDNWTVSIGTMIGAVTQNITSINGRLNSFQVDTATVTSDIGLKVVPVAQISTKVAALIGNAAVVSTIFGTLPGTVQNTSGKMANISTSVGFVTLDISRFQSGGTDNTALLLGVIIAVLIVIVIAGLVLWRRR